MKILILLSYFDRPKLVRNALNSILNSTYKNWELVFGDDGSKNPGEPIAREILKDHLDKIYFVNSYMTIAQKLKEGIRLGYYANREVLRSSADIVVTLCDDDELVLDYLENLSDYFEKEDCMYAYSKVHIYNPLFQSSRSVSNLSNKYNQWDTPINPLNKLDASQVAFRSDCFKKYNIRFPETTLAEIYPYLTSTDAGLFEQLWKTFGDCHPTKLISQYKGVHDYQLVWSKNDNAVGINRYINKVQELAGVIL